MPTKWLIKIPSRSNAEKLPMKELRQKPKRLNYHCRMSLSNQSIRHTATHSPMAHWLWARTSSVGRYEGTHKYELRTVHPSIHMSVCPSHMHIFSILPTLKKTHLFKQTHLLASVRIVFDIKTTSKPRKSSSETSQSQRNRRNNNKKSSCHSWHKVTHAKQIETLTITTTKLDSLKQQQQNRT